MVRANHDLTARRSNACASAISRYVTPTTMIPHAVTRLSRPTNPNPKIIRLTNPMPRAADVHEIEQVNHDAIFRDSLNKRTPPHRRREPEQAQVAVDDQAVNHHGQHLLGQQDDCDHKDCNASDDNDSAPAHGINHRRALCAWACDQVWDVSSGMTADSSGSRVHRSPQRLDR